MKVTSISLNKRRETIRNIARMGMFLAFLVVGSWININTGLLKFTLQIMVIFMIGLLFNLKESMIIILSYIFLGLLGLPVFANFGGGIAYVYSPTFGFVYGFIFALIVMFIFKRFLIEKAKNPVLKLTFQILSCVTALLVVYLMGFMHGELVLNLFGNKGLSFSYLLGLFIAPYIPFDLLKIVAAIFSVNTIGRLVNGSY